MGALSQFATLITYPVPCTPCMGWNSTPHDHLWYMEHHYMNPYTHTDTHTCTQTHRERERERESSQDRRRKTKHVQKGHFPQNMYACSYVSTHHFHRVTYRPSHEVFCDMTAQLQRESSQWSKLRAISQCTNNKERSMKKCEHSQQQHRQCVCVCVCAHAHAKVHTQVRMCH